MASQVTTPPGHARRPATPSDTAPGLTCGHRTARDPVRRIWRAWHAESRGPDPLNSTFVMSRGIEDIVDPRWVTVFSVWGGVACHSTSARRGTGWFRRFAPGPPSMRPRPGRLPPLDHRTTPASGACSRILCQRPSRNFLKHCVSAGQGKSRVTRLLVRMPPVHRVRPRLDVRGMPASGHYLLACRWWAGACQSGTIGQGPLHV